LVSVKQPAELATGSEIGEFASKHALAHATVEDVLTYRSARIDSEERRRAACQTEPHELYRPEKISRAVYVTTPSDRFASREPATGNEVLSSLPWHLICG
jgi:hypothetical protein